MEVRGAEGVVAMGVVMGVGMEKGANDLEFLALVFSKRDIFGLFRSIIAIFLDFSFLFC